MAELNLQQITVKLNDEFTGDTRKLVFWYDDKGDFAEDIDTLELNNAKLYRLQPDNQFYTKYFFERVDRTTNYLIYAPFSKPQLGDNHLADMIKYSKEFFADRASLLSVELGIDEKYKPIIQKYMKFFAAKDRTQRFYDLEIENFTPSSIEIALMSVLCKTRTASFEEVVRVVLTDGELGDNKLLADFAKYDLLEAFWRLCEEQFGYSDSEPSLGKLVTSLFVTYVNHYIDAELPQSWTMLISYKSGNIIGFLNNLMNNVLYRDRYNELSRLIAVELNAEAVLGAVNVEVLLGCDAFALIDELIIQWGVERLLAEDTGAQLKELSIPLICQERRKKHFGDRFKAEYYVLEHAYQLIMSAKYDSPPNFQELVQQYCLNDWLMDWHYRHFYSNYDQLKDKLMFERLRDLVENIYSNEYLAGITAKWNSGITGSEAMSALPPQRSFYSRYVQNRKERIVVIISDAMRYEMGRSLFARLQDDEKCSVKLEAMLGVLPSYTRLGMAALLPHKSIELSDDYRVLVDGNPCDSLKQREAALQRYNANSVCIQYDELKLMKREGIRQLFHGMEVIYIYHNQIDARGDKASTENEVFIACEEAVHEIHDLIRQLTDHVSATHYIVTADHGFIYKRDKLQESDKISISSDREAFVNRRFIVADGPIQGDGIASLPLSAVLGNEADGRMISFPISSNVFKVAGGGQNYVHGGSSPQEMIIPVLDIKTEKGHKETRTVQIALISMVHKITNLITSLDFIQSEPISDVLKGTSFKLVFLSEDNEKISNENIYIADKKDAEPQKRMFRLRFNFKHKVYDKSKRYYLVAIDEGNNQEVLRHEVVMDIAFDRDFGFQM